jgi:hypothetical protein
VKKKTKPKGARVVKKKTKPPRDRKNKKRKLIDLSEFGSVLNELNEAIQKADRRDDGYYNVVMHEDTVLGLVVLLEPPRPVGNQPSANPYRDCCDMYVAKVIGTPRGRAAGKMMDVWKCVEATAQKRIAKVYKVAKTWRWAPGHSAAWTGP